MEFLSEPLSEAERLMCGAFAATPPRLLTLARKPQELNRQHASPHRVNVLAFLVHWLTGLLLELRYGGVCTS